MFSGISAAVAVTSQHHMQVLEHVALTYQAEVAASVKDSLAAENAKNSQRSQDGWSAIVSALSIASALKHAASFYL